MAFLIANKEEFEKSNIEQFDFIVVTGDAYVDHPSFGIAIISRILEDAGYLVGIIAQPKWDTVDDFMVYGKPRLAFLVSGGNIDSMVNHYTVAKKRRHDDMYSPNKEAFLRPDRATIVYSNKIKEAYKDVPIILGGVEASLRRLSHYDYWDNKVRRSILLDAGADILVYGMAELQILEIAEKLNKGYQIDKITDVNGTCFKTKEMSLIEKEEYIMLPSFVEASKNKKKYNESFKIQNKNTENYSAKRLVEQYDSVYVVQNKPERIVTTSEFDRVYALPYERNYHPMYEEKGGVPAITEVKYSIINNRGCYGNCKFCSITFHQGSVVQGRSLKSIVEEAKTFIWDKDFKGYIHDVGGPTANFREPACAKQAKFGACLDKECLYPEPCKNLKVDHKEYLKILRALRELPNVKKVFIRSGIRYDYLLHDKSDQFFEELVEHHVSGQLKVAPEHISNNVLKMMGKPSREIYDKFQQKFYKINNKLGKKQFLVPYLMSSHPGSTLDDAIELALYLRDNNLSPEQVQDFYPTPGTLSTCIFYTGVDPYTDEEVYVPKTSDEKAMQRALIQYKNPKNYELVKKALIRANRQDLIGFDKNCLIRPKNSSFNKQEYDKFKGKSKAKAKPTDSGYAKGKSMDKETNSKLPKKKKMIRNVHKKKK